MTVHAFIDESRRGRLYLVAAAISDPASLGSLRRHMRGLLLPGQRELHFKKEKPARRKMIADSIAQLPVQVRVYTRSCDRQEELVRQDCMSALTSDLVEIGAHRLVIDSRQQHRDIHDERTIKGVLGPRASKTGLTYEHLDSTAESLLWIPDAVAWCYGEGGDMRGRVERIVHSVISLD
jgi:hypothetical protein